MIKLIINADDLGYSRDVNRAIVEKMEAGKVTSATAMANAPAFEEAVAASKAFPNCSFGLHLVLTEFATMSGHPAFFEHGVVDEEGVFKGEQQLEATKPSIALIQAVVQEWDTQYSHALAQGLQISHVDSHQHVHGIPWLFPALKRFQRMHGIRKVRTTKNLYAPDESPPSNKLRLLKSAWHQGLRHIVRTDTTDFFTSFEAFHALAQQGKLADGSYELMCHPGHEMFADETRLLGSDWECLLPAGYRKISFLEL